ncbi:MAG: hypothetical protein ABI896_04360, partial [Actinomycetota bacterium]
LWVDRVGLALLYPNDDLVRPRSGIVLRSAKELSAADLAAVIGGPRRDATAAFDRLAATGKARSHDAGGYTLWRPA